MGVIRAVKQQQSLIEQTAKMTFVYIQGPKLSSGCRGRSQDGWIGKQTLIGGTIIYDIFGENGKSLFSVPLTGVMTQDCGHLCFHLCFRIGKIPSDGLIEPFCNTPVEENAPCWFVFLSQ